MKKMVLGLFLILCVTAGIFGYFYSQKDRIVLKKITLGLEILTGAPSDIMGAVIIPTKLFSLWKITIKKIVIHNQGTFRIDKMAIVEDVEMEFDPLALFVGKWRIQKLSAHLHRGYFQVNAQGVLNAGELPGIKMLMSPSAFLPFNGDGFHADRVELKYGKFYRINDQVKPEEKKTYTLAPKVDVYMNVNNPNLLVQAPVFTYISSMNLGSFGLPRGKLQESIRQYVGQ